MKQGAGSKDCLAVDIVSAPNDDRLYMWLARFDGTLTFDVMHPNTVSNNIFVAKFDPQGNELWFRKCGGGNFNQVSDLHWSAANDLLVTGDQSGTLYWSEMAPRPLRCPALIPMPTSFSAWMLPGHCWMPHPWVQLPSYLWPPSRSRRIR
ncbi:MAG: hypothetical protein IPO60_05305 [Flavobacteriales bacterium]|nr:hypothetical protein [Flavobacteriales bacterium]